MSLQVDTFIDATHLTRWVRRLLYLQALMAVIALISGAFEYRLLHDLSNGVYTVESQATAAGEANDARQGIIGILQLVVFAVSGVLFLYWTHRANFNARQLGAREMQFTPGWAVGWYFIPLANLWKPYQAMKEIWQTSFDPQDWQRQAAPALLGWWWFFWMLSNVAGNAAFRMALKAEELDALIAANVVTLLSDATTIPLCLTLLALVGGVHEMQMARRKRCD